VVVLGGLIDDSLSEATSKVPLLGDIPVLGNLFTSKRTVHEKKNLMVFLRPRILRNEEANRELATENYHRIRKLQKQAWENGIKHMPDDKPPLLPPEQFNESPEPAPIREIDLSNYE